jgi:hypothetical protein
LTFAHDGLRLRTGFDLSRGIKFQQFSILNSSSKLMANFLGIYKELLQISKDNLIKQKEKDLNYLTRG